MKHMPETADVIRMIERAIAAERKRLLSALTAVADRVDGPARALATEIAKELSNG